MIHNNGHGHRTFLTVCKVSIVKGRLIFNAGFFKSIPLIKSQEDALPIQPISVTADNLFQLMSTNHQDVTEDPKYSSSLFVVNVGVVQVANGQFSVNILGQTDALGNETRYVKEFKFGVPHGYGESIEHVQEATAADPSLAQKIASDPKAELLKLLNEETILNPAVKGPFTILLLRNDGTVSDFSDEPLCEVPPEAVYIAPKNP
jgi:hypothetical protein